MARRYTSLAAWMRATHLTQAKLASEMAVSPAYISMLVQERRRPSVKHSLWLHKRSGGTLPLQVLNPAVCELVEALS